MRLSRRDWVVTCGAAIARWRARGRAEEDPLDRLLEAHAEALPERPGAGANHYPMAAEVLVAMGHAAAIADSWRRGARGYEGEIPREAPLEDPAAAFGRYDRYGDLLDVYRASLRSDDWRDVVAREVPRLAPGLIGGAFHGLIRTGHAVRALRSSDSPARRRELAVALAYWAARYTELPAPEGASVSGVSLRDLLRRPPDSRLELGEEEVDFFAVTGHVIERAIVPPVRLAETDGAEGATSTAIAAALDELVTEAARAFLEMLVLERHRIWLLHTVTAPAAVGLILPELGLSSAARLVANCRQGVVAFYSTFGAPHTPNEHLRETVPAWNDLIDRAAKSGSVHTIKLIDALRRFAAKDDRLFRSVAAQWFEWE